MTTVNETINGIFIGDGVRVIGTSGAGYIAAGPQSSAPATPSSGFNLYSNASNQLSLILPDGFTRAISMPATSSKTYTIPDVASSSFVMTNGNSTITGTLAASNFSGTSSGTNTGDVTFAAAATGVSANAASLAGQVITLQVANASGPGVVSTGAQTFLGVKTFTNDITASANINLVTQVGSTAGLVTIGGNRFISSPGTGNAFFGFGSGNTTLTGVRNTVIGNLAATALTTGTDNTCIGELAGSTLTTGINNTIIGKSAGGLNLLTGSDNICVGRSAGAGLTTGNSNICIGNTGVGTDDFITRIGTSQTVAYISGTVIPSANVDVPSTTSTIGQYRMGGTVCMHSYLPATGNFYAGKNAGNFTNTGTQNTVYGSNACTAFTTAAANVVVGQLAAQSLTIGGNNVIVGRGGCGALISGNNNTLLGASIAGFLTTGSSNIIIGSGAGSAYTTSESNNILIKNNGVIGDNQTIRIGGNTQTSVYITGIDSNTITDANLPQIMVVDPTNDQLLASTSFAYRNFTTGATVTVTGATTPTFTNYTVRASGTLTTATNSFSTGSIIEVTKMGKNVTIRIPFFTISRVGGTHTTIVFTFTAALFATAFASSNIVALSNAGATSIGSAVINTGATTLSFTAVPAASFTGTYGVNNNDIIFTYLSTV